MYGISYVVMGAIETMTVGHVVMGAVETMAVGHMVMDAVETVGIARVAKSNTRLRDAGTQRLVLIAD